MSQGQTTNKNILIQLFRLVFLGQQPTDSESAGICESTVAPQVIVLPLFILQLPAFKES